MSDRVCTEENPYDEREDVDQVYHPEAIEVERSQQDGHPSGDTVKMRCPICGVEWEKELPQ